MKKLATENALCIECLSCEAVCSQKFFGRADATLSAIKIETSPKGAVIRTCTQCGACMAVCPVQAISRNGDGVVVIDTNVCVGCLACVGFCPFSAMFHKAGRNEPFKCVACGECAAQCPTAAIFIKKL